MQTKTLGELADHVNGKVLGDREIIIKAASTLENAAEGQITFLTNRKYEKHLQTTKASAVIAGKEIANTSIPILIAEDPYYAFMRIVVLLHGHRKHKKTGISSQASISSTAKIGSDCHIHNFVTIEDNVVIGDGCIIYPGSYIGTDTQIGSDCIIYPNVTIYNDCKIGNRVIINSNTAVGEDGFGYATHKGEHHKIPHIGTVTIEDDVEIGSCCGIERGAVGKTIIGKGSKLGDLIAIGHGAKIGANCLLVPQVGIAGSATLGHHCMVGGQAGILGHINIGNSVMIAAKSGVASDVDDGKMVMGAPAVDAYKCKRTYGVIYHLPEMRKSLRRLEKKFAKLENPEKSK